jgi:hypothetical protein
MPAHSRWTISVRRRVRAGVEQASMEETAECADAAGVSEVMGIDRPGCSAVREDARSDGMVDGAGSTDEAARLRSRESEADVRVAVGSARRKRPLVGRVAAKPTVVLHVWEASCSCLVSP